MTAGQNQPTILFLSAGHNPHAPGVKYGPISEHEVMVDLVSEIYDQTAGIGWTAEKPYNQMKFVPTGSLDDKVDWINKRSQPGDIAVELHLNSYPEWVPMTPALHSKNANPLLPFGLSNKSTVFLPHGCECLVYDVNSKAADIFAPIQDELFKFWRRKFPGYKGRGIKSRPDLKFLRKTKPWACIVEIEFIWHGWYVDRYREEIAEAIIKGVTGR